MFVEHDLFGKPAATFPDHALAPLLGVSLELSLQCRELGERRIRIGRLLAPLEAFDRRTVALALRTIVPLMPFVPFVPFVSLLAMFASAAVTRMPWFLRRRAGRSCGRLG
jgi:hypothetical protein